MSLRKHSVKSDVALSGDLLASRPMTTPPAPPRPRWRASRLVMLPAVAAVAIVAGACSGGGTKTGSASTTTAAPASVSSPSASTPAGSAGFAAARARYTSCMEAHGVPASEANAGFGRRGGLGPNAGSTPPSTATPPTTTAVFGAAFTACRSDLPTRGAGGFANLQNSAAGRAYLQCLQLHGVTVPSGPPTTAAASSSSSRSATTPGAGGGLASNPAFAAARQACAPLAPAAGVRGGATTTTTAG